MDFVKEELVDRFIGRPAASLTTPSLIISKPVLERNCRRLLQDVDALGVGFRAHVKTLKCTEITRLMLGRHKHVVVSTLRELRGLLPMVWTGAIDSVLYGLPIRYSALVELARAAREVHILLMIDHVSHIDLLERYGAENSEVNRYAWDVFVKVDVGTMRAGIPLYSPRMKELVQRAEGSNAVRICGFYCHAGHSYGCKDVDEAVEILEKEVDTAVKAAELLERRDGREIVISFGATPTAHVVAKLKMKLPAGLKLELHAGNFVANDLQQVATGCVRMEDQAVRVLAEVCSVYPERNEALVNAGTIAMSKETSSFPGYGTPVDFPGWNLGRLSQEHGILVRAGAQGHVSSTFVVGQRVFFYVQHACIASASHGFYFVVDEADIVREIWYPWRGW
ncbi:hypothetical protein K402DRAFT_394518 [Aulographum hederae CBS 113979]|uniref:D-serine dehydratase n=1 Tax=Aulographum hederae CBS 113979 TaxID=1176131 RepID=A0A6G1GXR3_9PEZI|nr:hypothetical protein K402DRAFT_394518 [Aulographum hederae CBS 113979]